MGILVDLATTLLTHATTLESHLSTANHPLPSLNAGSPPLYPHPTSHPDIFHTRTTLIHTTTQLLHLILGPAEVLRSIAGPQQMQLAVLNVIEELDIASHVPRGEGQSVSFEALAARLKVERELLERVMRFGFGFWLFKEEPLGCVAHTALSETLPMLSGWVRLLLRPELTRAVFALPEALRVSAMTSESPLSEMGQIHVPDGSVSGDDANSNINGVDAGSNGDAGSNDKLNTNSSITNSSMTTNSQANPPPLPTPKPLLPFHIGNNTTSTFFQVISRTWSLSHLTTAMESHARVTGGTTTSLYWLHGFDWPSLGTGPIIDVGGGNGHIILPIATHFPALHFIIQDLPSNADAARRAIPPDLAASGRVTFQAQDFFQPQPKGLRPKVYFLKSVLHDWDDADCVRILKRFVPAVVEHGARIWVVDRLPPRPVVGKVPGYYEGMNLFMDLVMYCILGAKERVREQWEGVLARVDERLRVVRLEQPVGCEFGLLEIGV